VDALLAASGGRRHGGRVFAAGAAEQLRERVRHLVDQHHAAHPLEPGASLQSVRAALDAPPELVDEVLRAAVDAGEIEIEAALVRRRGWAPTPSPAERETLARLRGVLVEAGREPPSVSELQASLGQSVVPLLRLLEREGAVVQVEEGRYYAAAAVAELLAALRRGMERGREYNPSELRDLLGVSRKFLIPFLEFCDRRKVTERRAAGRVLGGT
jgi:selenocysteine-specific elongation factor